MSFINELEMLPKVYDTIRYASYKGVMDLQMVETLKNDGLDVIGYVATYIDPKTLKPIGRDNARTMIVKGVYSFDSFISDLPKMFKAEEVLNMDYEMKFKMNNQVIALMEVERELAEIDKGLADEVYILAQKIKKSIPSFVTIKPDEKMNIEGKLTVGGHEIGKYGI